MSEPLFREIVAGRVLGLGEQLVKRSSCSGGLLLSFAATLFNAPVIYLGGKSASCASKSSGQWHVRSRVTLNCRNIIDLGNIVVRNYSNSWQTLKVWCLCGISLNKSNVKVLNKITLFGSWTVVYL